MSRYDQQQFFTYVIHYNQRGVGEQTKEVYARLLSDALNIFCNECIKEDNTGIFFELENADMEYFKQEKKFHIVKTRHGTYGIVLTGLELKADRRNENLLALRAKRELLGISIPKMIELTGCPSYKAYEQGRHMKYDQYQQFMEFLTVYETGVRTSVRDKVDEMIYEIKNKLTKEEVLVLIDRLRKDYI